MAVKTGKGAQGVLRMYKGIRGGLLQYGPQWSMHLHSAFTIHSKLTCPWLLVNTDGQTCKAHMPWVLLLLPWLEISGTPLSDLAKDNFWEMYQTHHPTQHPELISSQHQLPMPPKTASFQPTVHSLQPENEPQKASVYTAEPAVLGSTCFSSERWVARCTSKMRQQ